jgi:hypothetical protein
MKINKETVNPYRKEVLMGTQKRMERVYYEITHIKKSQWL